MRGLAKSVLCNVAPGWDPDDAGSTCEPLVDARGTWRGILMTGRDARPEGKGCRVVCAVFFPFALEAFWRTVLLRGEQPLDESLYGTGAGAKSDLVCLNEPIARDIKTALDCAGRGARERVIAICTGVSLGAAFATLNALVLGTCSGVDHVLLVTQGSPKVLSRDAVDHVDALCATSDGNPRYPLSVLAVVNLVHDLDPIPRTENGLCHVAVPCVVSHPHPVDHWLERKTRKAYLFRMLFPCVIEADYTYAWSATQNDQVLGSFCCLFKLKDRSKSSVSKV